MFDWRVLRPEGHSIEHNSMRWWAPNGKLLLLLLISTGLR